MQYFKPVFIALNILLSESLDFDVAAWLLCLCLLKCETSVLDIMVIPEAERGREQK